MYSAKHHEYQLVAKSTVPCFLTRVIFTMSIFSTVVCPAVPPKLGGGGHNANWGQAKKIPALHAATPEFVPPTSKPCRHLCLTGLRPWSPLGDFRPSDPLICPIPTPPFRCAPGSRGEMKDRSSTNMHGLVEKSGIVHSVLTIFKKSIRIDSFCKNNRPFDSLVVLQFFLLIYCTES